MAVDEGEVQRAPIRAGVFHRRQRQWMGGDKNGQCFVPTDLALANQVLVQLAGLGRKAAGNAGNAAVGQWCHPREQRLAVNQKTFTN